MRELTESHNIIIFIDELHTLVGAGLGRGQPGRRQHPEAGALAAARSSASAPPRRPSTASTSRRTARWSGASRRSRWPRRPRRRRSRSCAASRTATRSSTTSPTSDEALEAAVYQSSRYITDRFLPDKAIDLLDEAGSRVKLRDAAARRGAAGVLAQDPRGGGPRRARRARPFFRDEEVAQRENLHIVREHWDIGRPARHEVTKGDIDDVVSKWTGIPHHRAQGRGVGEAPAHGGGAAQAHRLAGERDQRGGARHPPHARRASRTRTGRWARSSSWARPAWARPRSRAAWPRSCSAASARWSASTCPSTWRSTRSAS